MSADADAGMMDLIVETVFLEKFAELLNGLAALKATPLGRRLVPDEVVVR